MDEHQDEGQHPEQQPAGDQAHADENVESEEEEEDLADLALDFDINSDIPENMMDQADLCMTWVMNKMFKYILTDKEVVQIISVLQRIISNENAVQEYKIQSRYLIGRTIMERKTVEKTDENYNIGLENLQWLYDNKGIVDSRVTPFFGTNYFYSKTSVISLYINLLHRPSKYGFSSDLKHHSLGELDTQIEAYVQALNFYDRNEAIWRIGCIRLDFQGEYSIILEIISRMMETVRVEIRAFGVPQVQDQGIEDEHTDWEEDFPIWYYVKGLFEWSMILTQSFIALYQTQPKDKILHQRWVKLTKKFLDKFNGMKDKFEKDNRSLELWSGGFGFHFVVAEYHWINNLIQLYKDPEGSFGFIGVDSDIDSAEEYEQMLSEFNSNEILISNEDRRAFYDFFITGYKAKHMRNPFNNWVLFNMPDKDYIDESIFTEYEQIIEKTINEGNYWDGNWVYDGWNFSVFKPTAITYKKQIEGYLKHINKWLENHEDLKKLEVFRSIYLGRELVKELAKLVYLPFLYGHDHTSIIPNIDLYIEASNILKKIRDWTYDTFSDSSEVVSAIFEISQKFKSTKPDKSDYINSQVDLLIRIHGSESERLKELYSLTTEDLLSMVSTNNSVDQLSAFQGYRFKFEMSIFFAITGLKVISETKEWKVLTKDFDLTNLEFQDYDSLLPIIDILSNSLTDFKLNVDETLNRFDSLCRDNVLNSFWRMFWEKLFLKINKHIDTHFADSEDNLKFFNSYRAKVSSTLKLLTKKKQNENLIDIGKLKFCQKLNWTLMFLNHLILISKKWKKFGAILQSTLLLVHTVVTSLIFGNTYKPTTTFEYADISLNALCFQKHYVINNSLWILCNSVNVSLTELEALLSLYIFISIVLIIMNFE